ncbi:hypothetical protein HMSSN139_03960 [Paenibacillus sp. HMSSN-139]|nr:hypothetical protein HMSSN139_03960 [Paenibacillus sp. HMSSN-139]
MLANDIHPHKAKLIEDHAKRLGLDNIDTLSGDALQLAERLDAASFDRILLDAPCSGLGVIRRKPDLKWAKTPGDIAEIAGVQRALLDSASVLLKPGGLLVYSTCTIEPRENAEMVASFLNRHPEFELAAGEPAGWKGRTSLEAAAGRVEAGLQICRRTPIRTGSISPGYVRGPREFNDRLGQATAGFGGLGLFARPCRGGRL